MTPAARLAPPLGGARPKERVLYQGACAESGHVSRYLPGLGGCPPTPNPGSPLLTPRACAKE